MSKDGTIGNIDKPALRAGSVFSRTDIIPIAAIILLSVVLYWPMFMGRPVMPDTWERFEPWNSDLGFDGPLDERITNSNNDAILLYIPWNAFAHRELSEGRIPSWDPNCMMGVPLASNHLVPVFYPVYALIAWLASPLFIMGISGLVHTLILCLFFYLFIKEWLGNRFAAWICASVLMTSMLPNPHYQPWPMTLAFFPGIWFFYERWLKHRNWLAGLWMALCWTVPLIAGYPSLTLQMSMFTVAWMILRARFVVVEDRPKLKPILAIVILPIVLAIGLSAVQNVPTFMASQSSDRTFVKTAEQMDREASFTVPANQPWQMHMKRLTQPFIPWKFPGNDFFNRGYVGLIPAMLALYGLLNLRDKRYPWWLALMALVVAPFALVPAINFAVYRLTGGIAIDPNPPVEVFGFMMLLMAAAGAKIWEGKLFIEKPKFEPSALVFPALASCLVLIELHKESFIASQSFAGPWIFLVLAISCLWGYIDRQDKRRFFSIVVILFLCVGLFGNAWELGNRVLSQPYSDYKYSGSPMPETESIAALEKLADVSQGGTWGRMIRWDQGPVNVMSLYKQPYTFYPNLGTYFGIPDTFGYFNLAPKSSMDFLRSIDSASVIENRGIVCFEGDAINDPRLDTVGARYLLTKEPLPPNEKWMQHLSKPGFNIYINKDSWPRTVVICDGVEEWKTKIIWRVAQIVNSSDPTRLVASVDGKVSDAGCTGPATFVFNEAYSDGWSAKLDGANVPIRLVAGAIMGVEIPDGSHMVEFKYTMPGLVQGMWITLVSMGVLIITGIWIGVFAGRRKRG
jgi:hypothetical protein